MRAEPGDTTEERHDDRGNRPDDKFQRARECPVRSISRPLVRGAKPPRKSKGRQNDRYHDHQHDRERIEENKSLRNADRTARIKHAAASRKWERKNHGAEQDPSGNTQSEKSFHTGSDSHPGSPLHPILPMACPPAAVHGM